MLHPVNAGKAFVVDVGEHPFVVDLSGRWFFAAGVVADLVVGDFVPGSVDVGDEVALLDLLVVDVE